MSAWLRAMLVGVLGCMASTVLAAAPPTTAPTTNPADSLAAQRQSNEQQCAREAADYPLLPPAPLKDVVAFRLEKNNLAIYTRLPPTVGKSHLVVTDLPGICTFDSHALPTDAPVPGQPYRPTMFSFERRDFSRPGAVDAGTTVMINPMNIQISQEIEYLGTGMRQVSLIQTNPGFVDSAEPAVRLRVLVQGNGNVPDVNLSCNANDFVSLRRMYRAQTARYLEPIFRELHAESELFDADPRLAWQIFAPQASPAPGVADQVAQLVRQLDSDSYRKREAAAAELRRIGEPAYVALKHMDRSHDSPEQNSRIDAFLSAYQPVSDTEAARLQNDPDFLLDCLYLDDPFIVQSALDRLRTVTHQAVQFDPSLRDEPRREAIATLRQQLDGPPTTAPVSSPG